LVLDLIKCIHPPSTAVNLLHFRIAYTTTVNYTPTTPAPSTMSGFENRYGLFERHERYAQDTKLFLNELVTTSKNAVAAELWEFYTGLPQ
jgi:hypothetical protein